MKKRKSNAKGILLISFLLFAVIIGGLIFRKFHTAATRTAQPPEKTAPAGTAVVSLYFASPDGKGLKRESRELEVDEGVEERVESVVEELVSGPVGDLAPTLPANTRVLGVTLNGSVARIDFGHEFKEGVPAGSSAEMTAVYSVVDTVAANFPQIKAVQFLVEGSPVESAEAHLDLKEPVPPDYSMEQK